MPQLDTHKFNKEKLVFLVTSLIAAAGLYIFLASAPVALATGKSIGNEAEPSQHDNIKLEDQYNIGYYLAGGMRNRKTPFSPAEWRTGAPKVVDRGKAPPPPPPLPPDEAKQKAEKLSFDAKDLDVQISFVGTIMARPNEPALALLRSKVDGNMLCKKEGDVFTVGGVKYTVDHIEKQAIWVTDGDGNPYILNDGGLAGGDVVAASSDKAPPSSHKAQPAPKQPAQQAQPSQPQTPPKQKPAHPGGQKRAKNQPEGGNF